MPISGRHCLSAARLLMHRRRRVACCLPVKRLRLLALRVFYARSTGGHNGGMAQERRQIARVIFLVWGRGRDPVVGIALVRMFSTAVGSTIYNMSSGCYRRVQLAIVGGSGGGATKSCPRAWACVVIGGIRGLLVFHGQ